MALSRRNIMFGTAGHVDHGKTALVKLLTGCNTDRLPEEQRRGMTIELGFAPCQLSGERQVGIVDVPGHVDFIRTMAAGTHGIDAVIFVIAADDGVMPQTREHLDILTLLGIRHGLVALTKIDLIDGELRELLVQDLRKFLKGTFLAEAPICPISNITGEGFEALYDAINQLADQCPDRPCGGLLRLWIERSFAIHGFGTVVSGIPVSGEVRVGDHLVLQPGGLVGRVRHLEVYGQEASVGRAGECVAMNLTDIDGAELKRGKVLCQDDSFPPATMVEAAVQLLSGSSGPLKDYSQVHLHIGTAEAMARVALLEDKTLVPGGLAMAQLRLDRPLSLAVGERFIIRHSLPGAAEGHLTTIGGGRILGTSNVRLRRGRSWTIQSLRDRHAVLDDPAALCELDLKQSGQALTAAALARRTHQRPERVIEMAKPMLAEGRILDAGQGRLVHRDVLADVQEKVLAAMDRFHTANPLRAGLPEDQLPPLVEAPRELLSPAVASLLSMGKLRRSGTVLGLAGRGPKTSSADEELCARIERTLQAAGLTPPGPEDLAASLKASASKVQAMLRLLIDQGKAVRLEEKLVMHRSAVDAAAKVVLDLFDKSGGFETVQFRDALGVSRKYAVPLLDYFDTQHLTVRSGSRRTAGREAKRLLTGPKPDNT